MKHVPFAAAVFLGMAARLPAPPPLVTGDVPTADKHHIERYVGVLRRKE